MIPFLPLNRYLQYLHLQQQRGLLVLWKSHFNVKKRLSLITHILSGETDFTDWLQTDIIMDFDENSLRSSQEVGEGVKYCVCVWFIKG